mmetsp:Transcript_19960/g.42498  ORF Transcript_19960/g.42498 Transcript_19960/m.42498 type:complete len:149 (+) Transcript_19960:159-605(+)
MSSLPLHAPDDATPTIEWFERIGAATANVEAWAQLAAAFVKEHAAATVFLVKQTTDSEVDILLERCKLKPGYKAALRSYLSAVGCEPFEFVGTLEKELPPEGEAAKHASISQRNRQSLGAELGPKELSEMIIPTNLRPTSRAARGLSP